MKRGVIHMLGKRLRDLRLKKGLKQLELAGMLGVSELLLILNMRLGEAN